MPEKLVVFPRTRRNAKTLRPCSLAFFYSEAREVVDVKNKLLVRGWGCMCFLAIYIRILRVAVVGRMTHNHVVAKGR
jgi:hypothetical protein